MTYAQAFSQTFSQNFSQTADSTSEVANRQYWMSVLARADLSDLETYWQNLPNPPKSSNSIPTPPPATTS